MALVRMHRVVIRANSQQHAVELLRQTMYEVAFAARLRALAGTYSTGTLADSIERDGPIVTGDRILGSIGSSLRYAAAVHDGAKVHAIFPKSARGVWRFGSRKRPQLRFFWRRVGHVVYMPHVPGSPAKIGRSHPGQEGKHYLTEPLRLVARRHGFHVIVYSV